MLKFQRSAYCSNVPKPVRVPPISSPLLCGFDSAADFRCARDRERSGLQGFQALSLTLLLDVPCNRRNLLPGCVPVHGGECAREFRAGVRVPAAVVASWEADSSPQGFYEG